MGDDAERGRGDHRRRSGGARHVLSARRARRGARRPRRRGDRRHVAEPPLGQLSSRLAGSPERAAGRRTRGPRSRRVRAADHRRVPLARSAARGWGARRGEWSVRLSDSRRAREGRARDVARRRALGLGAAPSLGIRSDGLASRSGGFRPDRGRHRSSGVGIPLHSHGALGCGRLPPRDPRGLGGPPGGARAGRRGRGERASGAVDRRERADRRGGRVRDGSRRPGSRR